MSDQIRYIPHQQIDDKKWDQCISASVNGNLYAYSWYLNLVCERWDALVEGDYQRVFPLPFRRKAFTKYVYTPYFTQQLGLFSIPHLGAEHTDAFLRALPKEVSYLDLNLNTLNKVGEGYDTRPNTNYELELISSYEKLSAAYSDNIKRNIAKAEKARLQWVNHVSPAEIIDLFRWNKGKDVKAFGAQEYAVLERLLHRLMHQRRLSITGAIGGPNQLLAGLVIAEIEGRSVLLFSATERRNENYGALPWLIDRYIRAHSGAHRILDFEGSNDPGLARFYKGFGASETIYLRLLIDRLNPLQRIGLKLFRSLQGK